ncbi:hypothetical protein GA0061077_0887 [Bifidobacterium commune]|uniref:Uncharacterized protein n=1 Tax=Bifidobacterium commune TaxID=1505727 RepID=A0A1C4H5B6_9BIFI|nr:hypothetical protein GA0061077_0887 [Bifidobacterium commune]
MPSPLSVAGAGLSGADCASGASEASGAAGVPLMSLTGVACGAAPRCAAAPGVSGLSEVLLVCCVSGVPVSGFSDRVGGGGPYCHGYAQRGGDDGVEDAHGCPTFS